MTTILHKSVVRKKNEDHLKYKKLLVTTLVRDFVSLLEAFRIWNLLSHSEIPPAQLFPKSLFSFNKVMEETVHQTELKNIAK